MYDTIYCSLSKLMSLQIYAHTQIPLFLLLLWTHVKQQEFSRLVSHALDLNARRPLHIIDVRTITLPKQRLTNLDLRTPSLGLRPLAHNYMRKQLPRPLSNNLMRDLLARRKDTRIHTEIRLQPDSMLRIAQTIRRLHDPAQPIRFLFITELLRLIMRLQPPLIRLGPDLQKVHLIVLITVVFGMPNPRSRTRELHFAALQVLEIAHAVLVLERAVDDVAEDQELGVRVCAEACAGLHAVFVNDAQGAPGLVARVVVRCEGECVVCVEPVVVGVAAMRPGPLCDLHACWSGGGGHCAYGRLGEDGGEGGTEGAGERQGYC